MEYVTNVMKNGKRLDQQTSDPNIQTAEENLEEQLLYN